LLHVNLRPAEEPIRLGYFSGHAGEGEIFLVEEETAADAPALEWSSPDQLDIRCPRCNSAFARTMNERWRSIHIRYAAAR
jgi:hypothetical protein